MWSFASKVGLPPPSRTARSAAVLLLAAACASPSARVDARATRLGLTREVVRGAGFDHVVYASPTLAPPGSAWHVYLAGDAPPRRAWRWFPPDPTPEPMLALELLARDPAPRLLLGRPCQHRAGRCSPVSYAGGRYGEPVVASLAAALRRWLARRGGGSAVLIGYSGGGTLAMLLAERLPEAEAVVTVAGNLDVAAWARRHGHRGFGSSLDPAARPPLPPRVRQLHLAGGRDEQIPPELVRPAVARQPGATVRVMPGFDHRCCWAEIWPAPLRELGLRTRSARPR